MMRRWPLRWKVAFYAAMLGIAATIAGATTTWSVMRYKELATFDQRLASDAQELFRDIANFEGGWEKNRQAFQEKFVPLALRNRYIEIHGPKHEVLYRSPNLSQPLGDDGIEKFHTHRVGDRSLRMGTFHEGGLTSVCRGRFAAGQSNRLGHSLRNVRRDSDCVDRCVSRRTMGGQSRRRTGRRDSAGCGKNQRTKPRSAVAGSADQ